MEELNRLYKKEINLKQKLFIWNLEILSLFFFVFILWNPDKINNFLIISSVALGVGIMFLSFLFLNLSLKIDPSTIKEIKKNKKLRKYLFNKTNKRLKDITLSDLRGAENGKN